MSVESEKQRTAAALGELHLTKQQIDKRLEEKDEELEGVKYALLSCLFLLLADRIFPF